MRVASLTDPDAVWLLSETIARKHGMKIVGRDDVCALLNEAVSVRISGVAASMLKYLAAAEGGTKEEAVGQQRLQAKAYAYDFNNVAAQCQEIYRTLESPQEFEFRVGGRAEIDAAPRRKTSVCTQVGNEAMFNALQIALYKDLPY